MLFNENLLFLHVPKTGGMAVSKFLLQALPKPLYYTQLERERDAAACGATWIEGVRHETLCEAAAIVGRYGWTIQQFPLILVGLRNPYELEVSRYAYLQKGHQWDAGENQRLAMEDGFESFAVHSQNHGGADRPIQNYYLFNSRVPLNLRFLRCERLADELGETMKELSLPQPGQLSHDNVSDHGEWRSYYTAVAEKAVYRRYKWVFDQGLYPRLNPLDLPAAEELPPLGSVIPITGPVHQVGHANGLWSDGWVGDTLRFKVRADKPVSSIRIDGYFPWSSERHSPFSLNVAVSGTVRAVYPWASGPFSYNIPCRLEPGGTACVTVKSSATVTPCQLGLNDDDRRLSFLLNRVSFSSIGNSHEESGDAVLSELQ